MAPQLYDEVDDGVVLRVHAQPAAGRSAVTGRHGDALKVKVGAPPADGRANAALVALLAGAFGVKEASVTLVSGQASRTKRFHLAGVAPGQADAVLDDLLTDRRAGRASTAVDPPRREA